jgi:Mce-associated membrane protein
MTPAACGFNSTYPHGTNDLERNNGKERTGMTNSIVSDDEKVDDTESQDAGDGVEASDEAQTKPAAEPDETDDAVDDDARPKRSPKSRLWPKRPKRWGAAILVAAVLACGVFGFMKYHQVTGQLAELRRDQADRDTVAQLAKDYALRSLTYSFEDPDAFFRSVEDGVSQQLKDKYVNATDLLKSIMLQAQVTSSGEVLATDPVAQPGGAYQVVVSAHQTTRNLQNPTPKVSIILLQVTVNKAGNAWQVSDIGPKTGSHPPVEDQIPPPEPPPAPAPAPAKPAPKR